MPYITVPEAAERVAVTEGTIHRWMRIGAISKFKSGSRTMVDVDELDAHTAVRPA